MKVTLYTQTGKELGSVALQDGAAVALDRGGQLALEDYACVELDGQTFTPADGPEYLRALYLNAQGSYFYSLLTET